MLSLRHPTAAPWGCCWWEIYIVLFELRSLIVVPVSGKPVHPLDGVYDGSIRKFLTVVVTLLNSYIDALKSQSLEFVSLMLQSGSHMRHLCALLLGRRPISDQSL